MTRPCCLIPARGGSKRLPRKNILPLGGRPMLAWTVEAAAESGIFDRVLVSTEDAEIAAVAAACGAEVPELRDPALAGDTVTNVAVALDLARRMGWPDDDAVVCLQPSSPLRTGRHIAEAWQRFVEAGADFLVSVGPVDPHHFHWAMHEADGRWQMVFGDRYMTVRQGLPAVFGPNGAVKIARLAALSRKGDFFGEPLTVSIMPQAASLHVATRTDLAVAEALMAQAHGDERA